VVLYFENFAIIHFCFLKTQENLIGNVQKVHDILQETTDVTDDTSDILTTTSGGKTLSEKLSTNSGEKTVSENIITESSEVWENTGRSIPPFSAQSTRQTMPVEQVQNGGKIMRSLPRCALLLIVFVSFCLSNFDISTFLR
jgi:hypothetical protein